MRSDTRSEKASPEAGDERLGAAAAMSLLASGEQTARAALASPGARMLMALAFAIYGTLGLAVSFGQPPLGIGLFFVLFATFLLAATLAHKLRRQARWGVVDGLAAEGSVAARPERKRKFWREQRWYVMYGVVLTAAHLVRHMGLPVRLGVILLGAALVVVVDEPAAKLRQLDGGDLAFMIALFVLLAMMTMALSAWLLIITCICFLLSACELIWAYQDARLVQCRREESEI